MTAAKKRAPKFICSRCLSASATWSFRCRSCGVVGCALTLDKARARNLPLPMSLASPADPKKKTRRWPTGLRGLDLVLGGGATPGSVTLVAALAGSGKTTMLLGSSRALAKGARRYVYCVCEGGKVAFDDLALRLGVNQDRVWLLYAGSVDELRSHVERVRPSVLVIDSLNGLAEACGRQPVDVMSEACEIARGCDSAAFITTHLNSRADVAGPEKLKNLVDCVLWIDGDHSTPNRELRTTKNRLGDTAVRASLKMTAEGLVDDVARVGPRALGIGCALGLVRVDGRAMLVEVQAAITPSTNGTRKIQASGCKPDRVAAAVAAVTREGIEVGDVAVRLADGLTSNDVALDAAILAAVLSAARGSALAPGLLCGEVGLDGTLRVRDVEAEAEATRLGLRLLGAPGRSLVQSLSAAHLRAV